ncbi:MAG: hypothetical protein HOP14_12750 [Acidobacteria bacterium]|nr:hypothetical protein [Acidobacteriota bacterium]
MSIDPVGAMLDALGVRFALIGAHAMAARGYPRFTLDIDLLTVDGRVLDPVVWSPLADAGASVTPRRGDADDPLGGVVHVLLPDGTDIDIIVGKWKWHGALIARAERMTVAGRAVPVPVIGDLILLKLSAGGYGDLQDAAALLTLGGDEARAHVKALIGAVQPDITSEWRRLEASSQ